jgi:hypothetical protein
MKKDVVRASEKLVGFIPHSQFLVTRQSPEAFSEAMERLNAIVENIPGMYAMDGSGAHPLALHYFVGGTDIWVCEFDGEDSFFGYTILTDDLEMSEWGYSSRREILSIPGMNLDYHCHEATIEEALFNKNSRHFRKYDPSLRKEAGDGND